MGKLQNVTADELKALNARGEDICMELHGLCNRIEKGYCEPIEKPFELARSFLSLSRAAADMAALMMVKHGLQELQRETRASMEALAKQRAAKEPHP